MGAGGRNNFAWGGGGGASVECEGLTKKKDTSHGTEKRRFPKDQEKLVLAICTRAEGRREEKEVWGGPPPQWKMSSIRKKKKRKQKKGGG